MIQILNRAARFLPVIATLLCSLVTVCLAFWIILSDVPTFRGTENNVTYSLQELLDGHELYGDLEKAPYAFTQYMPFYYLVTEAFLRLGDIHSTEVRAVVAVARLLSFLFALSLLVVTWLILRNALGVRRRDAIVGMGFVFVATAPWLFLVRPDSLLILLVASSYLFMLLAANASGRRSWWFVAAATLLGVASIFTKQNGIQVPIVILCSLALWKDWKKLLMSSALTVFGVSILGFLSNAQLGGFFLSHVYLGIKQEIDFVDAFDKAYRSFFGNHSALTAVVLFLAVRWCRTRTTRLEVFLGVALGFTFLFASFTALKFGSAWHYYNEFLVIAAVAVAYALKDLGSKIFRVLAGSYVLLALPFLTAAGWRDYVLRHTGVGELRPRSESQYQSYGDVADFLKKEMAHTPDRWVFSSEGALTNLIHRHAILPQANLAWLSYQGHIFDYANFRADMAAGKVRFVVVRRGTFPAPVLGADVSGFKHVAEFGRSSVYAFNPVAPTRRQPPRGSE